MTYGYIHSFESFGAVDGPGIRFIVFLKGCLLKCLYCHNPDTWRGEQSLKMTAVEVMQKNIQYKNFISGGGVTISGGEPLLQPEFCRELIDLCHTEGIHTAIDTSGAVPLEKSGTAIKKADLLLLDIKDIDENDCVALTGRSNKNTLKTLDYCEEISKPVWIRHVIVPQYTLCYEKLKRTAEYLSRYKCIQRADILPYHSMGKYKWNELGLDYKLDNIPEPTKEEIDSARRIFRKYNINVI